MTRQHPAFVDGHAVADYARNARLNVPGLEDLHRMVTLLLADTAPDDAHMLVIGAGGGMETRAMADAQPGWRFTGVDPSAAMLDEARRSLRDCLDRVTLIEGTVETVEAAAFDGATCLLTFHHIPAGDRLAALRAIRDRLKPGAGLALVEHAAVGPDPQRWMTLSAAFRQRGKPDFIKARADGKMMIDRLSLGVPAETEALLRVTGFEEIALFYAAFSFRGWFARVP